MVGERTRLTVRLEVLGRVPADLVIRATIPEGTTLVAGVPVETLPAPTRGTVLERVYEVEGPGPVRIRAEASARGMGAAAEAIWPEPEKAEALRIEMTPVAPFSAGPVTIERAVVLPPTDEKTR